MNDKHNPLSGFLDVVQKTATDAVHAAGTISSHVTKGVVNTTDAYASTFIINIHQIDMK